MPGYIARTESPLGRIEIRADQSAVVMLAIAENGQLPNDSLPELSNPIIERAQIQLSEYFAGKRKIFDLPIRPDGTAFQKKVWNEISKLRFGETMSYGDIANAIGMPRAVRAIGGAVGANPVNIFIGCHRVLSASGKITGYSGGEGIPTKKKLLTLEGIEYLD